MVSSKACEIRPDDIEISLLQLWQEKSRVSATDVQRVQALQASSKLSLSELMVNLGMVSERERCETLSQLLNLQVVVQEAMPLDPVEGIECSVSFLRQYRVCPVARDESSLTVVMADPHQPYAAQALTLLTGLPVRAQLATPTEINALIERLYGQSQSEFNTLIDSGDEFGANAEHADVEHLRDMAHEAPVIRWVNLCIQHAVEWRASDIHIEPFENRLSLRYRVDGVMQEAESPPLNLSAAIISRIKIMAKLNIAERRLPQDGRMMVRVQGKTLDLRVSVLPTSFGESVVMRLLDREALVLDFKQMGFSETTLNKLLPLLEKPNGIILVTGPTGSGKTTSLYAALAKLNTVQVKIITVEDPVEYQLDGINQLQTKPQIGLDFANALRSIVRQDPDIIMIGEMRDAETARIAIQSALTGHLVLSTLHTNNAAGGITRLLDMGIEAYLLNSTINGIVAQRLVRTLEPVHAQRYVASDDQIQRFGLRRFQADGDIFLYKPQASKLSATGYLGRTVISELLLMNDTLRSKVMQHAGLSELEHAAEVSGMQTLFDDGLQKALLGITSIEEVLRVVQGGGE